jgi:hypothetical protein
MPFAQVILLFLYGFVPSLSSQNKAPRLASIGTAYAQGEQPKMPIRRYVEDGVVFTPKTLSAMSRALEETTQVLGIEGDENQRQTVARFIISIAREDDSLDAAALRDRVFAALGGIAYSATIPARPQPSNLHAAAE